MASALSAYSGAAGAPKRIIPARPARSGIQQAADHHHQRLRTVQCKNDAVRALGVNQLRDALAAG